MAAASASAIRAVRRVGTKDSGGVTARQLVQILDLMGVISNESHAASLMAEVGYAQTNGAATIYPALALDQLAEHLSRDGTKVSLPGRTTYRASAGPRAEPVAATSGAGGSDYRRSGLPQAQVGMSVAARLKAEFDQHKQHLQQGIDKRKSPEYLQERARLADLERKEAPKTGYEISERAGTSRRMQFAKAIAFVAIIVGMALVAKRRGRNIIGSLRARMREQLGR